VPGSSPPVVTKVEGHYDWEAKVRNLVWKLPIIDSSSKSGSLEFSVPSADPKGFFPLVVHFTSTKTFCDVSIQSVTNDDKPIKHTEVTSLAVEDYKIL
jgi:coatomer subunit delta